MARASIPTLLSLDRFAQVIGLNPSHFNGAANASVMPYTDCCTDIWFQYDWQLHGRVGRESLAEAIADAESDIARVLGYWPAPSWTVEEVIQYPRHHRRDVISYGMANVRGFPKGIKTEHGRVIAPGQRAVTLIGNDAVAYSDADGDGVNETATVSIATTLTDAREVKVYFAGEGGAPEWEIRPARTKAIAAGTFTATFWAWQLIDPDLWEALATTTAPTAIDWNQAANLVTTADVYREYNDTTATSATLYWGPLTEAGLLVSTCCSTCGGTGCAACTLTTQDGCLHVRDAEAGIVVPQAATYNSTDATWEANLLTECRDPDYVKLWYYSGQIEQRYLSSRTHDPLPLPMAQAIAWLAVARLERPFCSCDNVVDLVEKLRIDLAEVNNLRSYNVTVEDLRNPFGTMRGEVKAWKKIGKLTKKRAHVAVV